MNSHRRHRGFEGEVPNKSWFVNQVPNDSLESDNADRQLEVTCKHGPTSFKKHFLGLSDNVTYFVEQIGMADVSVYHYRVIFKPQTIIPNVDFEGSARAMVKDLTK